MRRELVSTNKSKRDDSSSNRSSQSNPNGDDKGSKSSGSSGSRSSGTGSSNSHSSSSGSGSSNSDSSSSGSGSSNSDSSSSGTGSSGSDSSSSSSILRTSRALSTPTAFANSPGHGSCPFCVADNDPRVRYFGPWSLISGGSMNTGHSTTTAGSLLTFTFTGSGIVVVGTVPQSNATVLPPTAAFAVDVSPPFATTQPMADSTISNQPLFAMSQLTSNDQHNLTIKVLKADTPFTIDYFVVFPPSNVMTTISPPSVSPLAQSDTGITSSTLLTIKLVVAFLGVLVLLLLMIIGVLMYRLRRRPTSKPKYRPDWPYSSPKGKGRVQAETILTSTESILRNNPSIMWSDYTRSENGFGSVYLPSPAPPLAYQGEKSPSYYPRT
ncbi:hypothetical protein C8J56DRAFT_1039794 [Mycena floridula]|nr:hypothetical protein C8J56DRAFT_1039794 [Mycena floridula]